MGNIILIENEFLERKTYFIDYSKSTKEEIDKIFSEIKNGDLLTYKYPHFTLTTIYTQAIDFVKKSEEILETLQNKTVSSILFLDFK
jgi:hypothetical protein